VARTAHSDAVIGYAAMAGARKSVTEVAKPRMTDGMALARTRHSGALVGYAAMADAATGASPGQCGAQVAISPHDAVAGMAGAVVVVRQCQWRVVQAQF
jgi:hypothetical protein